MVNFIVNKIGNNNLEHILKNINNKTIIITSNNNITNYKKEIIKNQIKEEVFVFDLKTFIYNIYRQHLNHYPILTKDEQRIFFLKAINKTDLKYLNQYPVEIIDYLIKIYNKEQHFKLVKNNYKTDIIAEINLVIKSYKNLIKDNYIDEEEVLNEVIIYLKNNDIYKDVNIFISDIYYFTELEKEFINIILTKPKNTFIYFLSDKLIDGLELHYENFKTLYRPEYNLEILNNNITLEKEHLINNLYNLEYQQYQNTPKNIMMFGSRNLYDEVIFVANQIQKNIREKNLRYNEFAIVSNCIDEYKNYFELVFTSANIPYHKEENINYHFFNYILTLLDIMENGYNQDNIKELLSFKLYNYSDFELNNIFKSLDKFNKENLDTNLKEILTSLKTNKQTVLNYLYIIYNHLENYNIIEKINESNPETWNQFIKYLNNINKILGEELLSITYLKKLFKYLFERTIIKNNYVDCVMVGDPSVINPFHKIVFFIGMNEGIVPKSPINNLLLNNFETDKYYENYPKYQEILIDKLNTHLAIAKPNNIYITYYKINKTGMRANPAPLINKIKQMYPNIIQYNKNNLYEFLNIPNIIYNHFRTSDNEVLVNKLNDYFNQIDYYKTYNQKISKVINFYNPTNLKFNNLYEKLYLSNSSLDTYNHCQFKYFCDYTLKLRKTEIEKYDNRIVGTYIHYLLEKLIATKSPRNNIKGMLNFLKQEFIKSNNLKLSNVEQYFFNKLNENVEVLWPIIYDELSVALFKPEFLEYKLSGLNESKPLLNINDIPIYLTGIVDRVDVYNDYFRVIDYKTGDKKFTLNDIANGINLQLLIYLLSISQNNQLKPAGFFYMPSFITFEKDDNPRQYRLTGMFLNEDEIINGLGGDNIDTYVKAYSRGKLDKNVLLSFNELEILLKYTKYIISKTATNIIEGNININPFKDKNICNYCQYKSICGIEKDSPHYRTYQKYKGDQIWELIGGVADEMDQ